MRRRNNRIRWASGLGLLAVALASSCSSGGGGGGRAGAGGAGACADFSGNWTVTETCSGGPTETYSSTAVQSGCSLTITSPTGIYAWQVSGNTASITDNGVTCSMTLQGDSLTAPSCQGCSATGTRTGGGAGGAGGAPAGDCNGAPFWTNDPTCVSCMKQQCCPQMVACGPGTACGALSQCIVSYCPNGDESCIYSNCAQHIEAGEDAFIAMLSCNYERCDDC
jgi:hypothetical protein